MSEPIFFELKKDDPSMNNAFAQASASIAYFKRLVVDDFGDIKSAKLSFRNPELSEKSGKECFIYLWLTNVVFHEEEELFSGVFFEVHDSLKEWHDVGDQLAFEPEDIFDWMIYEGNCLHGGFTVRVSRERLSEEDKIKYDKRLGISAYIPLPKEA